MGGKEGQCIAPGCTRKKDGWKFCAECAEASRLESIRKWRIKQQAERKAKREAEKKAPAYKPKTKLCARCKTTEIPLINTYCTPCRDAAVQERHREAQRRYRQRDKTGPVHKGFKATRMTAKPISPPRPTLTLAATIQEANELQYRRVTLNPDLFAARMFRGAIQI